MSSASESKVKQPKSTRSSQQGGSWKFLLVLILLAGALAAWNAYSTRRDIALATGPADSQQAEFFDDLADRPDAATLFKSMSPKQRVVVARNIGEHRSPKLPKLVAVLLTDFDPNARRALTESLAKIAQTQPKEVAVELKNASSFQSLGVFTALRGLGPKAIPYVVEQLNVGDARPQAVQFLVESGQPAVGPVLAKLRDKDKDVKLAAVEALGKLRAREAAPTLVEMYQAAAAGDKITYLTALATIADPQTEPILAAALDDETLDASMKEQAALGLGRIATATSVARLWRILPNPDVDLTDSTIAALRLAGDPSLRQPGVRADLLLRVAAGVDTPLSDALIRGDIRSPDTVLSKAAIRAAARRVGLVADLEAVALKLDAKDKGDFVDAALAALGTTPQGRDALRKMVGRPLIGAMAERQLSLSQSQG